MIIAEITTGIPQRTINQLEITVLPFNTDESTCMLGWQLKDVDGNYFSSGNITLTPAEFQGWGYDCKPYLEDIVLSRLGLSRP